MILCSGSSLLQLSHTSTWVEGLWKKVGLFINLMTIRCVACAPEYIASSCVFESWQGQMFVRQALVPKSLMYVFKHLWTMLIINQSCQLPRNKCLLIYYSGHSSVCVWHILTYQQSWLQMTCGNSSPRQACWKKMTMWAGRYWLIRS